MRGPTNSTTIPSADNSWHVAIGDQLRSLGGRSLCRPCSGAMPNPAVTAWWFALPVLAAVGLAVAVRGRRTPPTALPLG
ncbi:hypothetical protein ACFWOB_32100 [Streptomyces sp. NPDC058420]|uniref:hypothetical protein n=1 Tax=Streptomyces sp. NPDC058420 TaxID=3346489 RepID=UPI0036532EA9